MGKSSPDIGTGIVPVVTNVTNKTRILAQPQGGLHRRIIRNKQALKEGVPRAVVLADAGYGADTAFRDVLTELGLPYSWASIPWQAFGYPERGHCRPRRGLARGGRARAWAGMKTTSR